MPGSGDDARTPGPTVVPGRSGHLLDWSANARALLVQVTPLAVALPWTIRLQHFLRDRTEQPYLSRPTMAILRDAIFGYALVSVVLVAVFLVLRRRKAESSVFVFVTLATLGTGIGFAAHVLGTLSSPMIGASLAVASAISLLFVPRHAIPAIAVLFVAHFAPLLAVAGGFLPYAPLFESEPFVARVPEKPWLFDFSFLSFAILVVPIAMQFAVIVRWRRKDELVHRLACFDPLTGVANRRHFFDLADHEMARAVRFGTNLGLVLLDIDHFKAVNDRFGHQVGDEALRHVADRLVATAPRKVDIVGRYGGEEFAILAPETGIEGLTILAERCREAIASSPLVRAGAEPIALTASFGIATVAPGDSSIDALIRRADDALYRAKREGRNRVET